MKIRGLNDNQVTVKSNLSKGILGKGRGRGGISQENVVKILLAFPELNANWWFRGDGNMIIDDLDKSENISFSEKIMRSQSELLDFKDQQIKELKLEIEKLKKELKERG